LNAGRAEIVVSNPAGALTADDVTRLFERFWRKEAARSGSGHHAGLGLPLARSFAEAMGWTLTAELAAEGRVIFRLAGPVAE
jgi:signal transduction histidine kinase